jgi:hypothetical protein
MPPQGVVALLQPFGALWFYVIRRSGLASRWAVTGPQPNVFKPMPKSEEPFLAATGEQVRDSHTISPEGSLTETDVVEIVRAGTAMLNALLARYGFSQAPIKSGIGSGGAFASTGFRRGERRLELHFRYSLGLVQYHLRKVMLRHEDYMWSVLGERWRSHYPGFSDDPLDGFRGLRQDLEEYGQDFLEGSDADFLRHIDRSAALKRSMPLLP